MNVDQLRRGIEQLPGYGKLSYYERWTGSIAYNLIENGVISQDMLDQVQTILALHTNS